MTDPEKATALMAKAKELIQQALQKLQESQSLQARADALVLEAERLLNL